MKFYRSVADILDWVAYGGVTGWVRLPAKLGGWRDENWHDGKRALAA